MRTQWIPVKEGVCNIYICRMKIINNDRIEFKTGGTEPCLLYGMIYAHIIAVILVTELPCHSRIIFTCFAFIFLMFLDLFDRVVFDKNKMIFWKHILWCNLHIGSHSLKSVRLDDIHAIQLLHKMFKREDMTEDGYELNIVLKDTQRINALCYENKNQLRKDAAVLARFLDKPLWDAIEQAPQTALQPQL